MDGPFAPGPRSIAGVKGPDAGGPNQEQDTLVTWVSFPSNPAKPERFCR